ncbi:MAG: N-acetyltransferase [Thermodesulfobacteriota bacterium]|nr:N-acetyltransferase [Thermodesulfobacteriota bacterium]
MLRKAIVSDVREIFRLINNFAKAGEMLPRSLSELYDNLRDYYVYLEDSTDKLVGTCALHVTWEDLAEIRSLAVEEDFSGRGIGIKLVESCISEAVTLGIDKIFVLTYKPAFFEKLGFKVTEKSTLPHKIWADCIKCIKFPDCDEISMLWER